MSNIRNTFANNHWVMFSSRRFFITSKRYKVESRNTLLFTDQTLLGYSKNSWSCECFDIGGIVFISALAIKTVDCTQQKWFITLFQLCSTLAVQLLLLVAIASILMFCGRHTTSKDGRLVRKRIIFSALAE